MLTLPNHLKYAIRLPWNQSNDVWHIRDLFDMDFTNADRPLPIINGLEVDPYLNHCFLTIQNDIDRKFIEKSKKSSQKIPEVVLQRFPYPSVSDDEFMNKFKTYFSLLFVLCMILSCKNIIKVSHL